MGSKEFRSQTNPPKRIEYGPPKSVIADFIGQSGVIKGFLTFTKEYQDETTFYLRRNALTGNLNRLPKNTSLDPYFYGEPENKPYRRPDFVVIIEREEETRIKYGCIIIVIKKSRQDFDHYPNNDGRGRGQPLRDAPWFIEEIKRVYQTPEENIEVSCYTLTAYRERDDAFVIDGESLLVKVPASKVLPYAGRICHHNFQVDNLLKRIYSSENEVRRPIWYI